jgi:hypothetical protein
VDTTWLATPGKIVLGRLGDIEAGVRQLIRQSPIETEQVALPSGNTVVVPRSRRHSG